MERTAENIWNLYQEHLDTSPLEYTVEVHDQNISFGTRLTFTNDGEYAGFCEIYFGSGDEIAVTNHVMEDASQNLGSYKALCKAIPPIGRALGYAKTVIAVPAATQNTQLDDVHTRSGFERVSASTAEVDISQPNSAPERYARGE